MNARSSASGSFESRPAPPLGGFNLTLLAIEIRRMLRNRRTVVLTLVFPIVLFLLFRSNKRLVAVQGTELTAATTMIGVAVYGAMLAATSGGAMVSIERALGWSRQLRVTPLRPAAYISVKIATAMLLGFFSMAVIYAAGWIDGVAMSPSEWITTGILAWAASVVFAALGLLMGYLLPAENVMQVMGFVLAMLGVLGGLFWPVNSLPSAMQTIAPYMPTYGVAAIARFPLVGGAFDPAWLVNMLGWTILFSGGAMLLFRRDTRRV
jgi:ABC-2 type transport system permease protein